jgi:hypothetical protein
MRRSAHGRCAIAVAAALWVVSPLGLTVSASSAVAGPAQTQASHSLERGVLSRGACEREAEGLVGQKPARIGGSARPPKKLRSVPPAYPELPAGTVGRGVWLGEVLIDKAGRVAHVWPIREVKLVPPFPAFNDAIVEAMRQQEYEPLLVRGTATPFCITVAVNINWGDADR